MSDENDGQYRVRVTFKGGQGFEAPWITVGGTSVSEVLDHLKSHGEAFKALTETVATYAKGFQSEWKPGAATPVPAAGASAPAADGGPPRCSHGVMKYAEGVNQQTKKPYRAYYCTLKTDDWKAKCPKIDV